MENKSIQKNIMTSVLLQIVTIICAFILPRMILATFGSAYNGIVNSVNQFLSCVTLLRAGIGGVTRAALYKPLAESNFRQVSAIVKATEQFMRKIAYIFTVALLFFGIIYPLFVKDQFDYLFSFSLVIVLGISTISQYYFGITYQMLLQADQKLYVYNFLQIGGTFLNTVISVILMKLGFDIRIVKLGSAIIFGLIPVYLFFYVKKTYNLDSTVKPDNSTIAQRWDAFAHQVAAFVHSNTDIMVLTIFSNLYEVSIYSVYALVTNGIKQLITTCSAAIESMFGDVIARNQEEKLKKQTLLYEWLLNVISSILLLCAAILIVPFIIIYTSGVNDANYNQPLFGYLMCFATFCACVRLPYQNLVEAAGHFKKTRNGAICEAIINVLVSIVLVRKFGCIGVAIGTIVAMVFRTIQYADYASKNILHRPLSIFIKRFVINILTMSVVMGSYYLLGVKSILDNITTYSNWIGGAFLVGIVVTVMVVTINIVFYKKEASYIFKVIRKKIARR